MALYFARHPSHSLYFILTYLSLFVVYIEGHAQGFLVAFFVCLVLILFLPQFAASSVLVLLFRLECFAAEE
jgi:hypothetical protein